MAVLNVDLGSRSYPIYVGPDLISQEDLYRRHVPAEEVVVVTDETVAALYLDYLLISLGGFNITCHILPDGEEHKTLETLGTLFDTMIAAPCSRETTLIALGGGVVGDIAGFAAACYQRGIRFIQIPTTLLAQVDSAVGGKTAVNHPLGKNMIGAFYQPACVIADTKTLSTLEGRQLSAGIAEVVKYGAIRDPAFFAWLEENMEALCRCDDSAIEYAILECCRNKAELVAADETERADRALLNLGHTFGHAIESATGYGQWLHGEAVAAGIVLAAQMSCSLGWLAEGDVERIRELLLRADLPVNPPKDISVETFLSHMSRDKKVADKRIRLVLLEGIGRGRLVADYPDETLTDVLAAAVA